MDRDEPSSFGWGHHPSTREGQIEGAQRFAPGLRARPWKRWIGLAIVAVMLLPVLIDVVSQIAGP